MKKIFNILPTVKLIIILRRPDHRATSEFFHHCRHKRYNKLKRNVLVNCKSAFLLNDDKIDHQSYYKLAFVSKGTIINQKVLKCEQFFEVDIHRHGSSHSYSNVRLINNVNDVLEPIDYPCTSNHFQDYYFGEQDIHVSSASDSHRHAPIINNPWASAEYGHGDYHRQISDVLSVYASKNVKILFQDDLFNETLSVLYDVETFLQSSHSNSSDASVVVTHYNYTSHASPRYKYDTTSRINAHNNYGAQLIRSRNNRERQEKKCSFITNLLSSSPSRCRSDRGVTSVYTDMRRQHRQLHNLYLPQLVALKQLLENIFNISMPSSWLYSH